MPYVRLEEKDLNNCLRILNTSINALNVVKKDIIKFFRYRQLRNIKELYSMCIMNEQIHGNALKEIRKDVLRKIAKQISKEKEEDDVFG